MANPFDQFDSPSATPGASGGNPFDRFDGPPVQKKLDATPVEESWAEKHIAPLLQKLSGAVDTVAPLLPEPAKALNDYITSTNGNLRGSRVGSAMMGAADPGVAIAQLGANILSPVLAKDENGKTVAQQMNRAIANTEVQYQQDRSASREQVNPGFDAMRLGGNIAITAPTALLAGTAAGGSALLRGATQGALLGLAEPVTDGGDHYWTEKAKQAAIGGTGGAVTGALSGALSKVISPKISDDVRMLMDEGVTPTPGQILGGGIARTEEKLQSVPILGDAIAAARKRAEGELQGSAFDRALSPIGQKVEGAGREAIADAQAKLGASYEKVLPKLSVDVLDPTFVEKMSNLRSMAQSLPGKEAQQFDNIITREIDNRVAPNGVLSGQNLKDAWNALRDKGTTFSNSTDAYQKDLGQAFKQAFQELKDHVAATNPADVVAELRNTDLGYANFKRLQRASAALGSEGGNFTPAQLQNAVKAGDRSTGKSSFANGNALMQDLSEAGKNVLSTKYPDSGTAGRFMMGGGGIAAAASGTLIPAIGGLYGARALYSPMAQNMLAALLTKRPDSAPAVANYLRRFAPALTAAGVPVALQPGQR